ncbi:MAG: hypothetical protein IIC87_07595 [Chloroflexi bacterium]|nr:hypothetical protein [Chloroflexota bacterium]
MANKLHIPRASERAWETPTETFRYLDERFGPFDLDAACLPDQITAMTILGRGGSILIPPDETMPANWPEAVTNRIGIDGLACPWRGKRVWLNPPFNALADWLPKAIREVEEGVPDLVCVLMPARTDTLYWQEYVIREVRRTAPWANAPAKVWEVDAPPALHTVVNLPGRLTFIGADAPYTQPCCAVIYGAHGDVEDKEHP